MSNYRAPRKSLSQVSFCPLGRRSECPPSVEGVGPRPSSSSAQGSAGRREVRSSQSTACLRNSATHPSPSTVHPSTRPFLRLERSQCSPPASISPPEPLCAVGRAKVGSQAAGFPTGRLPRSSPGRLETLIPNGRPDAPGQEAVPARISLRVGPP